MTPPRDPSRTWEAAIIFAAITMAIIMLALACLPAMVIS